MSNHRWRYSLVGGDAPTFSCSCGSARIYSSFVATATNLYARSFLWSWTRSWVGDDQRLPLVVVYFRHYLCFWSVSSIPPVPQPCIPRKRRGRTSSDGFVPGSTAYISENGTMLYGERPDKSPLSDSHFVCPSFALGELKTRGEATGRLSQGKSMCWLKPTREASPGRGF